MKHISEQDLAVLLGVHDRTLRKWDKAGTGPKRSIEGLQPVYYLETLIPWLRKHRPNVKLGDAEQGMDAASRLRLLCTWEKALQRRYRLSDTAELYEALRHAAFHAGCGANPQPDPIEFWIPAAYASLSGIIVRHKLPPVELRDLLADFESRSDMGTAKKHELSPAEFVKAINEALNEAHWAELDGTAGPMLRNERDHCADAFRYMVCIADDYLFPVPNLPGFLTAAQRVQMNDFLEYLGKNCLIPSCKQVKLAAQRQIDDLQRSRAGEKRDG